MNELEIINEDIFLLHDFLTCEECDELIARGENIGFSEASVRTESGPVMMKNVRNNDRVVFEDPQLAQDYFDRFRDHLPASHQVDIHSLNPQLKYYRYDPGQRFKRHKDGVVNYGELHSRLTFMVYLNDDFTGGETKFEDYKFVDGKREFEFKYGAIPKKGTALFFRHQRWHEGSAPLSGRKYVIRSDIMYRKTDERMT